MTVSEIFNAFKEIYQYYLHRGFRITIVLADAEFAPVKSLIDSMPGGPILKTELEPRIAELFQQKHVTAPIL
jgi:hypothetical protein